MASFDLLREDWIPVADMEGNSTEVGILDLLRRAHEMQAVRDASPLVTCALYRFLVAVVVWCLELDDEHRWEEAWEEGRFTEKHVAAVAERCEGKMDLFHPYRPFFQDGTAPLDAKELTSIGYLMPDLPTGTSVTHFAHSLETDHFLCAGCCAKALVAIPAFATQGGRGYRFGINPGPPVYVVPVSDTLHKTLLLNVPLLGSRVRHGDLRGGQRGPGARLALGVPHTRGGEPLMAAGGSVTSARSPHTWG